MEPLEPLESHVLFARNDAAGTFEVGTIDQIDGTYVSAQKGTGFGPGWTHVVAVGPHVLLVRNDDRHFEVGHIDQYDSQYAQTDSGTFSHDWTHVVAVGPHVLLVRNDAAGTFEVGHIDQSTARYVKTDGRTGFASDWTHVVAVGPHVLFVDDGGLYAVAHIDESNGRFVETETGTFSVDWTHVVAVCSRVFLSRADQFVVGHINHIGQFVKTQDPGPGVGGTPNPIHVVAVGPRVLGVSPTLALGFVMHFNHIGQFVETQTGPDFASEWTHVVAVA